MALLQFLLLVTFATCIQINPAKASDFSPYFQEWLQRFGEAPNATISVSARNAALVIVDMQNDFVGEFSYSPEQISAGESPCYTALGNSSGACFGVAEGDTVAEMINLLLQNRSFSTVIASMDDHSPDHCSFFASASTTSPPAKCAATFAHCNSSKFHKCQGTRYEHQQHGPGPVYGPFPPHCVRGYEGTKFYSPIHDALMSYTGEKHLGIKGLDLSTDSFGVFRYSEASWDFYNKAGMFAADDPRPAVLIRSMLTWEQHMTTSTGASSFVSPFGQYVQPPPFSSSGAEGELIKTHANSIVERKGSEVGAILVTGLAGDWCVLDSALNAKAQWPDKEVYFVVDAIRPSYLPKAVAGMYLKKNPQNQLYKNGAWLHDPVDVAAVLRQAGVKVIKSDQIVP